MGAISKILLNSIAIFILSADYAAGEEAPAALVAGSAPAYPVECAGSGEAEVSLNYEVTTGGMPIELSIRQSSDSCFDDASVTAVRQWLFEPRRVDGSKRPQSDLDTTFWFAPGEPTRSLTFDGRPIDYGYLRYPDQCTRYRQQDNEEAVSIIYDVDAEGRTQNIRVTESTNSCFDPSALRAIESREFRPWVVDGVPRIRENVKTRIVFRLESFNRRPSEVIHRKFRKQLNAAGELSNESPSKALREISALQSSYGNDLSDAERALLYQVRGSVRIKSGDYEGALSDLKKAQEGGSALTDEQAYALDAAIASLESYLYPNGAPEDLAPKTEPSDQD